MHLAKRRFCWYVNILNEDLTAVMLEASIVCLEFDCFHFDEWPELLTEKLAR
jgi:hypothetical protein